MGFFSWHLSDTEYCIMNRYSDELTTPVFMLLPDGRKYREDDYDGYGVFGGKDVFVAIAECNPEKVAEYLNEPLGDTDEDRRGQGHAILFHAAELVPKHMRAYWGTMVDAEMMGLKCPRFTQNERATYGNLQPPKDCERQGYFEDSESYPECESLY